MVHFYLQSLEGISVLLQFLHKQAIWMARYAVSPSKILIVLTCNPKYQSYSVWICCLRLNGYEPYKYWTGNGKVPKKILDPVASWNEEIMLRVVELQNCSFDIQDLTIYLLVCSWGQIFKSPELDLMESRSISLINWPHLYIVCVDVRL